MIAVDTSALMAVLLREPEAGACITALDAADDIVISAATLAEALVVSRLRATGPEMGQLIEALGCEVAPVTEAVAQRVAQAYQRWGKGVHPAACTATTMVSGRIASSVLLPKMGRLPH